MKKNLFIVSALLISVAIMFGSTSCKKDSTTTTFGLQKLLCGNIDLNGATAPNNIPAKPTIDAYFNNTIDAATATSTNITLVRDYDNAVVACTITVNGSIISLVPNETMATGALHKLTFSTGLKSAGGSSLGAAIVRTFSTDGFFAPSGMVAYWKFEDDTKDALGTFNSSAAIDITYVAGRKAAAGKALNFNGTSSIVEIPNGDQLESPNFSLSFWVKVDTSSHPQGNFVIGLGAYYGFQFEIGGNNCKLAASYTYQGGGDTTFSTDNFWNGDGKTKDNGGYQGFTVNKDMTTTGGVNSLFQQKWAHVVCTYDVASKVGSIYINGEIVKAQDFNLWPITDKQIKCTGMKYGGHTPDVVNELAFGFIQSRAGTMWDTEPWGGYALPGANHFKGQLDDIRIFNKAVSAAEVQLMYDSEKP
ncbi:MAG: LamG-like jellyroll fold domain-containing protein [Bacteroidota bacterium]